MRVKGLKSIRIMLSEKITSSTILDKQHMDGLIMNLEDVNALQQDVYVSANAAIKRHKS